MVDHGRNPDMQVGYSRIWMARGACRATPVDETRLPSGTMT
jgi:hypothetical protein